MQQRHSRSLLLLAAALLSIALTACSGQDSQSPSATSPGAAPSATSTPAPIGPVTTSAHRFVPVGQSVDVSGLGEILEVVSLSGERVLIGAQDDSISNFSCTSGGTGYVRAQYRQPGVLKNQVQTVAVTCIDEVGDCEGQPPVGLDFEQFAAEPRGEADYLASGDGDLYAVCLANGQYRLQQAPEMPPLMLRLIDAIGDGPYTLDVDDLGLLDGSSFVSYSGDEHRPHWIATVAPEIEQLVIDPGGWVFMVELSCSQYPGCLGGTPLVRSGDMLVINFGVDLEEAVERVPHEVIRQFVVNNIGIDWSATQAWPDPEAGMHIVHRLVSLEIMKRLFVSYDRFYNLRAQDIKIGYMPFWNTRYRVTSRCSPDGPEWESCAEAEAKIDALEREQLAAWQAEGYELWHFEFLGHNPDGSYRPVADSAPSFDAFDGVAVSVEIGGPLDSGERPAVLVNALESLAEEIGDQPVIISANWGPMRFVVDGTPCEGEICVPAFTDYYAVHEPVIAAMLNAFSRDQLQGFGVALFDGGVHFDIENPVEDYEVFSLDRVGETGFNSPLMNLYLTR